jgi:hypothetical protein
MAGHTPNSNILAAIDEVITALNDLAGQFLAPDLTTLETNTEIIGEKAEAIRTVIETQSQAAITAQNTNFSDLVEAINGLTLTCAPVVNVQPATPLINFSPVINCGGGLPGGTEAPPGGATEGGTPPTGWSEPDPIDNRKCKAVNLIHDKMVFIIDKFIIYHIQGAVGLGLTAVGALILFVLALSELGPIGAFIGALAGLVVAVALALMGEGVDLDALKSVMENGDAHRDLICAFYSSTDAQSAIDNYVQVLADNGINTANQYFIRALFNIGLASIAFFKKSDAIEQQLDGYDITVGCESCEAGDCPLVLSCGSGTITYDGEEFTLLSASCYGSGRHDINITPTDGCCQDFQVELLSIGAYSQYTHAGGIHNCANSTLWDFNVGPTPPLQIYCCSSIDLASSVPFSARFKITGQC